MKKKNKRRESMKRIMKKSIAVLSSMAVAITLFVGVSVTQPAKADLTSLAPWTFYEGGESGRSQDPDGYPIRVYNSVSTTAGESQGKDYWDVGPHISHIDGPEVYWKTTKVANGFTADIENTGWDGEYQGGTCVRDNPWLLRAYMDMPAKQGHRYTVSFKAKWTNKEKAPEKNIMVDAADDYSSSCFDEDETETVKFKIKSGETYNYSADLVLYSNSSNIKFTIAYGAFLYSRDQGWTTEDVAAKGILEVSDFAVEDKGYDPEIPTQAPKPTTTTQEPSTTTNKETETQPVTTTPDDPSQWELQWSDEFDGDSLSAKNWTAETGTGDSGWGNNEQQYYTDSKDNIEVSNGSLKIHALKQSRGDKQYTSARIKTQGKQSFRYGKVEARMKLPSFQGSWPAFWMLGENINNDGWPKCGEMDIMEAINDNDEIYSNLHWSYNDTTLDTSGVAYNVGDRKEWHTYSMNWNENRADFYVDGKLSQTYEITDKYQMDELREKQFIILNLAIGGKWPGYQIDDSAFPGKSTMEVDYVRVYKKTESSTTEYESTKQAVTTSQVATTKQVATTSQAATTKQAATTTSQAATTKQAATTTSQAATTKQAATTTSQAATTKQAATTTSQAATTKQATSAKTTSNTIKVAKAKIKKINRRKKSLKLTLKKLNGVTGYQIKYSKNKKFHASKTKKVKNTTVVIKKLKRKTRYYIKARGYRKNTRIIIYGKYSKCKKAKTY